MACRAVSVEAALHMIRFACALEFRFMTGVAFRRRVDEFLFLLLPVAIATIRHGVRTEQWKPRELMLRDCFVRRPPPGRCVTVAAFVAQFALVLILMARRACGLHFRHGDAGMTRSASHARMIATQSIAAKLVIECDVVPQC